MNSAFTGKAQSPEFFLSISLFLKQLSFPEIQSSFRIGTQPSRNLKVSLKMKTDVQVNFVTNGINKNSRQILDVCFQPPTTYHTKNYSFRNKSTNRVRLKQGI